MNKIISVLLGAMLFSGAVYAGDIQVEAAWSRATAPGQDVAMVDLAISSAKEATLIGVASTSCKVAELHSMTHENGMMKMRAVESIALPAGKRVDLGKSGYHLMLIGLKAPLKAGESVPLILNVKVAKEVLKISVNAEVIPLTGTRTAPKHNEHMHH